MKISFSLREAGEILAAAIALSVAFAIAYSGGIFHLAPAMVLFSFIAVGIGFMAHELIGHKIIAQRFGLHAEFKMWPAGLVIALASSLVGFVFAAPGAVYIEQKRDLWGNPTPVSQRRMGIVSLMGPVINVIVAAVFFVLSLFYPAEMVVFGSKISPFALGTSINVWLALFNLIPVPPLDGSKVLAWNKKIFAVAFASVIALFILLATF